MTVVFHDRNRGKGAALQTALSHANGEFAAVLDADLEYRASDLGLMLEPLLSGDATVVFGTRAWHAHSSYGFWYVMGNKFVTFVTNLLYNCWISDVMTGHKAMRTRAVSVDSSSGSEALRSSPRSQRACCGREHASTKCRSPIAPGRVRKERS